MQPYCYDQDGTKSETKCSQLKIPMEFPALVIDYSEAITDLSFKASFLLGSTGAGPLLASLGCDIVWSIKKIESSFTGVQVYINMELFAVDLTKSNIALVRTIATNSLFTKTLRKVGLLLPVFEKNINMVNLDKQVFDAAPAPGVTWPDKMNQPAAALGDLAITAGTMDNACAKTSPEFSMSLLGADLAGLTPAVFSTVCLVFSLSYEARLGDPSCACRRLARESDGNFRLSHSRLYCHDHRNESFGR
jgi:hypothetical protein